MKPGVAARAAARRVVTRVMRSGAFTNRVVRIETAELGTVDARLARRLAYDTVRNVLRIDHTLAAFSNRPLDEIEEPVHDALRVGVEELLFARTSQHAAVDSTVEVVRSLRHGAAGFANAVLRSIARHGEAPAPEGEAGSALRFSQPQWIYDLLVSAWGVEEAERFLAASQMEAFRTARLRWGRPPHDAVAVEGIEGAYRLAVDSPRPINMAIQDGSSVAVGLVVGAQPNERVGDLAAAPGGKALHLLDQVGAGGLVVAVDVHPARVRAATRRPEMAPLRWCVADGRRTPFSDGTFDRVLVDAPCSGLGTLRRRPEVRFRTTAGDLDDLAQRQRRMVEEALRVVKPGGLIVYSVCTVTPQETVDVSAGLPTEPVTGLPGRPWGNGWLMAPHTTGTDGMYITRIRA